MARYQEKIRLERLNEIEERIMKEIGRGFKINLTAIRYWIYMKYGVQVRTAHEYLRVLEGSGKFEIDWENNLIFPLEEEPPEAERSENQTEYRERGE